MPWRFSLRLAQVVVEDALAQADRLRRHLDELVVVDELERLLEGQLTRRRQDQLLVGGVVRMLVSCFTLHGLTMRSLSRVCMPTICPP